MKTASEMDSLFNNKRVTASASLVLAIAMIGVNAATAVITHDTICRVNYILLAVVWAVVAFLLWRFRDFYEGYWQCRDLNTWQVINLYKNYKRSLDELKEKTDETN